MKSRMQPQLLEKHFVPDFAFRIMAMNFLALPQTDSARVRLKPAYWDRFAEILRPLDLKISVNMDTVSTYPQDGEQRDQLTGSPTNALSHQHASHRNSDAEAAAEPQQKLQTLSQANLSPVPEL
jgi:hypothetical protein